MSDKMRYVLKKNGHNPDKLTHSEAVKIIKSIVENWKNKKEIK